MKNKLFNRKPVNQTILGRLATTAAQRTSLFELDRTKLNREKINKTFNSIETNFKSEE